jgi:hypothetical protein
VLRRLGAQLLGTRGGPDRGPLLLPSRRRLLLGGDVDAVLDAFFDHSATCHEGRLPMSGNNTARSSLVTAAEWFAGGQQIPYDPESGRVVTQEAAAPPAASGSSSASQPRSRTTTKTPCGSRCCPDSRTAPTAGRGWTRCSATAWARGCTSSRSGSVTQISPELPVLDSPARGLGRGDVAAPRRAPHRRRRV